MKSNAVKYTLLFFSGIALTLSFAPFNVWPLSFFSLSILFYYWTESNSKHAFWMGLSFGIGFFLSGVYWIYIAIHHFGNAPIPLSVFLSALLILVLSLFIAINGYLNAKIGKAISPQKKNLCLYPATWVLVEWCRAHVILNGFPWLLLGYTQTFSVLNGWAPIIGVFGLSLITCLISGSISLFMTKKNKKHCIVSIALITATTLFSFVFQRTSFTKPIGKKQHVVLAQGNIEQSIKWVPSQLPITLHTYFNLTKSVKQPSLIVWPEGAVPVDPRLLPSFMTELKRLVKQSHSNLIFGTQFYSTHNRYYNGMLLMGDKETVYHKQHLVPFGEYYPMQVLVKPILHFLHMPPDGYTPGSPNQPDMIASGVSIAPFICYEIAYPSLILQQSKNKSVIVIISDDSWFGDSLALEQQLQITQMRALETQRYILACNNTGITAIVAPNGDIAVSAPKNKATVISKTIYPTIGQTPVMRIGFAPVWIMCWLLLTLSLVSMYNLKTNTNKRGKT